VEDAPFQTAAFEVEHGNIVHLLQSHASGFFNLSFWLATTKKARNNKESLEI
jgi:hypothetical protein